MCVCVCVYARARAHVHVCVRRGWVHLCMYVCVCEYQCMFVCVPWNAFTQKHPHVGTMKNSELLIDLSISYILSRCAAAGSKYSAD